MTETRNQTLNLAVLDPNARNSTYSHEMARKLGERLHKFALSLDITLAINIISCNNHADVISAALDVPNTVALQPIINTSTGLVPEGVYAYLKEQMDNFKFFGGFDLLIENRLICSKRSSDFVDEKVVDLLDPEHYHKIEYILTHKAPLGQCKAKIAEIQKANPNVQIIDTFESTSEAVAAIMVDPNSKLQSYKNAVAIGNAQTAQNLNLKYTKDPWQDYPSDNFTTFLAVGNAEKIDSEAQNLLNSFTEKFKQNLEKLNFIINLPIGNQIGSLAAFLSELHSEFGINLDYINVKSEYNDQSKSVKPYFSGSVDLENVDALQAYLKVQKAELVVFYPELDFDKDPTNDINKPEVDDTTKFDFELKINPQTGKISARVPNRPGGLSQLLDEIRDAGINLTDLEVFARGCEDFAVLTGSFDISNNS